MGYPMKKEMKIKLAFLYWELMCKRVTQPVPDYSRTWATIEHD